MNFKQVILLAFYLALGASAISLGVQIIRGEIKRRKLKKKGDNPS